MASPEFVPGDPRAQVLPFTALASFPGRPVGKGSAQGICAVRVEFQIGTGIERLAEDRADRSGRLNVSLPNTVIMAVASAVLQHGLADIIRPLDEPHGLAGVDPGDHGPVIGHEVRRVALAEKCQHAQQMVGADQNGHETLMSANAIEPKSKPGKLCFPGDRHCEGRNFAIFAG